MAEGEPGPWWDSTVGARVIIGLAVGSASMIVPLYIGEVVPPRVRAALVSFNQLAITSGILVSYLVDYGLTSSQNWRLMCPRPRTAACKTWNETSTFPRATMTCTSAR
jgi:MFS family permease